MNDEQYARCLKWIFERRQKSEVVIPEDAHPNLQSFKGIKAVVFDIYGTLFSSGVGDISLATRTNRNHELRGALENHGIRICAEKDLRLDEAFHEVIRNHQSKRKAQNITFPEVDIRSVWADFLSSQRTAGHFDYDEPACIETLAVDYETRVNPTQAMPGLETTLDRLTARGLLLGIISNAQFFTPLLFDTFLSRSPEVAGFDPRCSIWSFRELEGKPSKALYKKCASALENFHGIRPSEVLYIGNDMRNDIWPASDIGFRTVLFAGDRLSLRRRSGDADCAGVTAEAEITQLPQIPEITG